MPLGNHTSCEWSVTTTYAGNSCDPVIEAVHTIRMASTSSRYYHVWIKWSDLRRDDIAAYKDRERDLEPTSS